VRELRDIENKEYIIDKHYLAMKQLKEQYKISNETNKEDELKHAKYRNMTYMSFLNKQ
jgi:hypothetical protein